ncbi:MAG: phytanoyl-CoA dioxygenase family protein [Porticoccaceae bacterium]|nr:phytanoyl-CoA dioxygenase family protein [Porticoccaceae bacterium]
MSAINDGLDRYLQYPGQFEDEGVVCIPSALNSDEMNLLEEAYEEHFNRAKSIAEVMYGDGKDEIYFLTDNTLENSPYYQKIIKETRLADIVQDLFRGEDVYYHLEQMWNKQGGARRTAWHQDTAYLPFSGSGLIILWIPLEDLDAENVLEVVRGSHKSTLYNASLYDPKDVTAPLYDEKYLPRLPDIEKERNKWNIFSTAMKRGDVLALHPGCLHGGASTKSGKIRRSYTFRFFSPSAIYTPLPENIDLDHNEFSNQRQDTDERIVLKGFDELSPGDSLSKSSAWKKLDL